MSRELRVRLLGRLAVEGARTTDMGSRKARKLLRALALGRGRPVAVDALVEILWGDAPPAVPADQLSVLVSRLRAVLGPERLTRGDAGYALRCDWLDVDAAISLHREAAARLAAGSHASARAAADGCLALLRGPLLADEPDAPWADAERLAVERLACDVRRVGAGAALAAGDPQAAIELAEEALDRDAYDERALQLAMTALAAAGRPAAALRRYEQLRERLSEDLGVDPSPETRALHRRILRESVAPAEPAPAVPAGRREPPGRAEAMARLDAALARAAAGELQVVSVEGEAGMGKTELLGAWSSSAAAAGAAVLGVRCDDAGRTLPLQPLLDALQAHLRVQDAAAAERLLGEDGRLLRPLLDWRAASADGLAPASGLGPTLVFAAILRVIGRAQQARPVVLILDDLHLASPATADWIRYAERHGRAMRLLVLGSRRPEEGEAEGEAIELLPLDLAATRLVVGDERAAELLERSGGNPLFLVELAGAAPEDGLPASVREAVRARCDRAGAAGATLRNAAVIGPAVDLDLLAAVTQQPAVTLLDHLEEGVRRRILEEGGGGFRFRHALVREALIAASGSARQALLHREAGRALAARPQPDPLEVALHARLGGDVELAATALTRAASIAASRYDHAEAERLLDEAMALRDRAEGRLARARVRLLRGRYDGADEDAAAALAAGAGARALEVSGVAAYYRRRLGDARDRAEQGLLLARDPPSRAGCLVLSARALHALGDLGAADRRISEAVEVALAADLPAPAVVLAMIRIHQGRAAEALVVLGAQGEGLDASAQVYAAFSPLHRRFMTAYAMATLGDAGGALRQLDSASLEVERLEVARYGGLADAWRGWVVRQLGSLAEADERNAAAAAAAAREGYMESEAYSYLDLMDGRLAAGDTAGAEARLEQARALEEVEHAYRWRHRLRARWLEARLHLDAGRVGKALEVATELATDAVRHSSERYAVLGRLALQRARSAAGEPVDPEDGAAALERLPAVAGMEGWWLTAEHAAALGVVAWWRLAEARVARLAEQAGPRGADFQRYAATRLERIRMSVRTGSGRGPTAARASSLRSRARVPSREATNGAR